MAGLVMSWLDMFGYQTSQSAMTGWLVWQVWQLWLEFAEPALAATADRQCALSRNDCEKLV